MSIASELLTLASNKASIKSAIESRHPSIAPTSNMSQWPNSISSIYVPQSNEYVRPSSWSDIEQVLAEHPASEKGYGYAYAMLVLGNMPSSPHNYIRVPPNQAGCRHYVTSWGLDEDAPNSQQTWHLTEENGNSEFEWIVVYTDSAEDIALWGPNYSTYDWWWLLWFYAPDGVIKNAGNGFNGIQSLREVTCKKVAGACFALSYGIHGTLSKCNVEELEITSTAKINSAMCNLGATSFSTACTLCANLTDFRSSFDSIYELTSVDMSKFSPADMSYVVNAASMFQYSSKIKSIDTSKWCLSNATHVEYMFRQCY